MLGLLAVWPERLGAGSVGGAGWAALFYCHFLAVPLFPFSPVSLSSPFHLLGGAGSAVWLAGGLHRLGAAGSPSVLLLALVAVLASLGAGLAAVLSLSCVLSLSWVLALGFGAAVSLCPLSWVLAFLCCPLVLACYALGLGAGLGWGRCWAVQAVAVVAGWGWCALIWRAADSSYCTNTALQIWLLFKRKAINFERFFLDIAHKVRYNDTRVKEIVNPLQLAASPLLGDGWTEERNQLINLKGDRQNETERPHPPEKQNKAPANGT